MKKKLSHRGRKGGRYGAAVCLTALALTACGRTQDTISDTAGMMQTEDMENDAKKNAENGQEAGRSWEEQDGEVIAVNAQAVNAVNPEALFTDRDLEGSYDESSCVRILLAETRAECDSDAVSIEGGTIVIREEGVYLLSGTLKDGMVVVDAPETAKVQLVLADASISNSANAAIYGRTADKLFVTLAEGTVNRLENGGSYTVMDDNNIDAAVFSKCDLTVNGRGSLEVAAAAGHGMVSKDDLKVTGGNISVTAAGHGLSGKDSVCIAEGTILIASGKDGVHSEHDTHEEKGYVYIRGGELTVTSEGDGISASAALQIDGGSIAITAGGGSTNKAAVRNDAGDVASTKGIKGSGPVVISGGSFVIDAQDDALHSNGDLTVNGGKLQIATGDDGLHGDETTTVAGGYVDISSSYEGIEGNNVVISGGEIRLIASDDGINAAGGRDQSGFGGFFGRDSFGGGSDSSLLISGGRVYVNAEGDGVDSNGSFTVTGGELYISGPSHSGDGAIDYDGIGQITGGIVVAAGSLGMAMNFGDTSTQGSILVSVSGQPAGAEIEVQDHEGQTLLSYTVESAFDSVAVSCPEMVLGGTYTVLAGDSRQTVTLEEIIYGKGMGGFGGGPGGRGGFGMPEGPAGGEGFGMPENPPDMEDEEGRRGPKDGGGFGMPENPPDMEGGEDRKAPGDKDESGSPKNLDI